MCTHVMVYMEDFYTAGQLRDAGLRVDPAHVDDADDPRSWQTCMCGTDVEAILRDNGISFGGGGMDLVAEAKDWPGPLEHGPMIWTSYDGTTERVEYG